MSETALKVETELPLAWEPGAVTPATLQGSLLLLRVINLPDHPVPEGDQSAPERLEAKLDLMLHWLAGTLFAHSPPLEPSHVRLEVGGLEWRPASAIPVERGIVLLAPHPGLAAPLRLPARFRALPEGWMRAEFEHLGEPLDEPLREQWTRWLFRLHRRAIQSGRRG